MQKIGWKRNNKGYFGSCSVENKIRKAEQAEGCGKFSITFLLVLYNSNFAHRYITLCKYIQGIYVFVIYPLKNPFHFQIWPFPNLPLFQDILACIRHFSAFSNLLPLSLFFSFLILNKSHPTSIFPHFPTNPEHPLSKLSLKNCNSPDSYLNLPYISFSIHSHSNFKHILFSWIAFLLLSYFQTYDII